MSDRVFVDTNVLVYAYDVEAGRKHAAAKDRLLALWSERTGALSVQVLQEFYVNATRRIPKPLPRAKAREVLATYSAWKPIPADAELVLRAVDVEERHRIAFWDALIVAAAARARAATLLSEDLGDGRVLDGVTVENPFG